MKILYIAHRLPYPPNKGEKIRAFHQIRHLAARHELHLACLVDDPEDLQHIEALERICASVTHAYRGQLRSLLLAGLALFTSKPLSAASFYSRSLERSIRRMIREERFDAVIVYSSSVAGYVMDLPAIPKIMDFIDVDSEKWRLYAERTRGPMAWIYGMESRRLARREQEIAELFDRSILVSEREAATLRERTPGRVISVLPNGIDTEYFTANGGAPTAEGPSIVFMGAMNYLPNVDAVTYFCEEILDRIRAEVPRAEFCIVGRNPTKQVRDLARLPNVVVTGSVDDVRPYLQRAALSVAPLRIARGLQNKVLEAMAMGLPVVTTPAVMQGIEADTDCGVLVAEDAAEFAERVVALLRDPVLRRDCSIRARRYVESRHTWAELGADLEGILHEVTTPAAQRAPAG